MKQGKLERSAKVSGCGIHFYRTSAGI